MDARLTAVAKQLKWIMSDPQLPVAARVLHTDESTLKRIDEKGKSVPVPATELEFLENETKDSSWMETDDRWKSLPLDLRWLCVATKDKTWMLYKTLYMGASFDLRYISVLTGDPRWLHNSSTWANTPLQTRLAGVIRKDPAIARPSIADVSFHEFLKRVEHGIPSELVPRRPQPQCVCCPMHCPMIKEGSNQSQFPKEAKLRFQIKDIRYDNRLAPGGPESEKSPTKKFGKIDEVLVDLTRESAEKKPMASTTSPLKKKTMNSVMATNELAESSTKKITPTIESKGGKPGGEIGLTKSLPKSSNQIPSVTKQLTEKAEQKTSPILKSVSKDSPKPSALIKPLTLGKEGPEILKADLEKLVIAPPKIKEGSVGIPATPGKATNALTGSPSEKPAISSISVKPKMISTETEGKEPILQPKMKIVEIPLKKTEAKDETTPKKQSDDSVLPSKPIVKSLLPDISGSKTANINLAKTKAKGFIDLKKQDSGDSSVSETDKEKLPSLKLKEPAKLLGLPTVPKPLVMAKPKIGGGPQLKSVPQSKDLTTAPLPAVAGKTLSKPVLEKKESVDRESLLTDDVKVMEKISDPVSKISSASGTDIQKTAQPKLKTMHVGLKGLPMDKGRTSLERSDSSSSSYSGSLSGSSISLSPLSSPKAPPQKQLAGLPKSLPLKTKEISVSNEGTLQSSELVKGPIKPMMMPKKLPPPKKVE